MDEKKPIPSEPRSTEPEEPIVPRGISPGAGGARLSGKRQPRQANDRAAAVGDCGAGVTGRAAAERAAETCR
jgi:hypothetical protein